MFAAHSFTRFKSRHLAAIVLSKCVLLALTSPLAAQNDDWILKISEKELQLAHPTDMAWMKYNMWDLTNERMFSRNQPALELTNASGVDISQLTLTIRDTRFEFGADSFPGNSPIALGNTTPGFDLSATGGGTNALTITINGGLGPGEFVRFFIDLEVADAFADEYAALFGDSQPDFRTVLFDINAGGGPQPVEVYDGNIPSTPDHSDNALAKVTFSDGTMDSQAFADWVIQGPDAAPLGDPHCNPCQGNQAQFFNDVYRTYGIMENVDIFQIGGGGFVIPEPATGLLAAFALAALCGVRPPRRRR